MYPMVQKLYDNTLRQVQPVHRFVRSIAWTGGELLVDWFSRLSGFKLPDEPLFPLHKLEMLTGNYEKETVELCRRLLRPGMTVIDIGAHVGYFTLLFSRLVQPDGRVYAFEPHAGSLSVLNDNLSRFNRKNVTVIAKAVSATNGGAMLYETPLSLGHSLEPIKAYATQRCVTTTTLDQFLNDAEIDHVDLIKMDIEGHEPEALDGFSGFAKRARGLSLILECKPSLLLRRSYQPADLIMKLRSMGFTISAICQGKLRRLPEECVEISNWLERCRSRNLFAQKSARGLSTF